MKTLAILILFAASAFAADHAKYLPDPVKSPGVACSTVTVEDLRSPQFIRGARTHGTKDGKKITAKEKAEVYAEYGITIHKPGEYEVDHIISLELGGSNDIKNLWPEPYAGVWNAHHKDRLENELHRRVLRGEMTLAEAQHAISTDWVAEYEKLFPQDVVGDVPKPVGRQANYNPDTQ